MKAIKSRSKSRSSSRKNRSEPSLSSLKKKADAAFSVMIRCRDAFKSNLVVHFSMKDIPGSMMLDTSHTPRIASGWGKCSTCGKIGYISSMDCGHWISRSWLATRYHPMNAHLQCKGCNVFKRGDPPAMELYIVNRYGVKVRDHLLEIHRTVTKFSKQDYKEMIAVFNSNTAKYLMDAYLLKAK